MRRCISIALLSLAGVCLAPRLAPRLEPRLELAQVAASPAPAEPPREEEHHLGPGPQPALRASSPPRILPRWETDRERRARLRKDSAEDTRAFRLSHPELYGVTEPPRTVLRQRAEYDPVEAIYYAWMPGVFDAFFGAITSNLLDHTQVQVHLLHHGPGDRSLLESLISDLGHDPAEVTFVDVSTLGDYYVWQTEYPFDASLESFWIVDWGPAFVTDASGLLSVVDLRYYAMRVNDDSVPTKLASSMGVNVYRPDISMEGGNLLSDGRGTCFTTGMVVAENGPQSQQDVDGILRDYLGCEKTIWLWPLLGEPTGHVDMFFKNASATTVVLGSYDPAVDPDNSWLLEQNRQILEAESNDDGSPFEILRVAMPDNQDGVWRTYTNGIVVNDLVLVPTYPDHATGEASAMAVLQQAFPGRLVLGLDSEAIIWWGGAIHCVTRTRPAATQGQAQPPPAFLCGGDIDCTTGCGELTEVGDCLFGIPVYCEGGQVHTGLCPPEQRCGWLQAGGYFDCVDAGCGDIPPAGECHAPTGWDEVVVTCSASGFAQGDRCPPGSLCGLDAQGVASCQPCTDNACDPGDLGCDGDGDAWTCGLVDGGDNCLRVISTQCPADSPCEEGRCRCTDLCQLGERGCDEDGDAWTCGEAADGDDCLDRVSSPCRAEETCVAGVCLCHDQCQLGERGCDEDGNAWTCGEARDGDDCRDRMVTACGVGTRCQDATCVVTLNPQQGCGCQSAGAGATGCMGRGTDGAAGKDAALGLLFGLLGLYWRRRRPGGTP